MTERELHQEALATRVPMRQTPAEREVRLRYTAYYIRLMEEADKAYLTGKQQEGLTQFDREKGQLDTVRAWLWKQSPDNNIDALAIAEAQVTRHIGEIRDSLSTIRVLQQEQAISATLRQNDLHSQDRLLSILGNTMHTLGKISTPSCSYSSKRDWRKRDGG